MLRFIRSVTGPRIAWAEVLRPRFAIPGALLLAAAVLYIVSYWQPYWHMTLVAPQYPNGLHVGPPRPALGRRGRIDRLNHYIGMRPLNDAAQLEQETSWLLVAVTAALVAAGLLLHSRWAALLAAPAILFPAGFLLDLHLWLSHFGQHLDPHAPLANSVKALHAPVLGTGTVGQFQDRGDGGRRLVARRRRGLSRGDRLGPASTSLQAARRSGPQRCVGRICPGRRGGLRRSAMPRMFLGQLFALCLAAGPALAGGFDLQRAIDAAQPGDTVRVPAGRWTGTFTVAKPIVLEGEPRASSTPAAKAT